MSIHTFGDLRAAVHRRDWRTALELAQGGPPEDLQYVQEHLLRDADLTSALAQAHLNERSPVIVDNEQWCRDLARALQEGNDVSKAFANVMSASARALAAPLRRTLDYQSVGRRLFLVEPLPSDGD